MDKLTRARERIDQIDAEMARLFADRMAACAEIAAWKQAHGFPIRDPSREREVLTRNTARVQDPALRPYYEAFLSDLMRCSRDYQRALLKPDRADCLTVRTADGVSCVYLSRGLLHRAGTVLNTARFVFLVTDEGVPAAYAAALAEQCPRSAVFTVPQGEAAKSPAVLASLLREMLRAGLTRQDCVAAVGGGVVGDLAGLAAALYMRGIDFYNVPTTLLAMADSCIGGKTAIDFCGVKNVVGAFHQPKAVLIDPDVLGTLSPRQLSNGFAEAVKMALTHDAALFARLEAPAGCGPTEDVIRSCLCIKKAVVETDEKEQGLRRVLNFGHTLGHGIEAATGGTRLHGECVALGMLPMCAPEVRERLRPVLVRLGLSVTACFDRDRAMDAIAHDKKSADGTVEIVTVPKIGSYQFCKVTLPELRRLLDTIWHNP